MRDIAPTFALRDAGGSQEVVAIDWNFDGWGNTEDRRSRAGDALAKSSVSIFGTPRLRMPFVAEGGAFVTDGRGTVITTRSYLLNPNRNPVRRGFDRQRMIEKEIDMLGIQQTIWLEGDPCEAITSGHIDGYVLFAPGNVVMVEQIDDEDSQPPSWREHDVTILECARDARGHKLKVVRVSAPRWRYWKDKYSKTFAPCYLNACQHRFVRRSKARSRNSWHLSHFIMS